MWGQILNWFLEVCGVTVSEISLTSRLRALVFLFVNLRQGQLAIQKFRSECRLISGQHGDLSTIWHLLYMHSLRHWEEKKRVQNPQFWKLDSQFQQFSLFSN